jgi:hypothetical protein
MRVLSPYGKNVLAELKNIYGFESIASATEFVVRHVQQHYRLNNVSIEMLHIAYGLVAKLIADGDAYHLKFASHGMHDRPEQLVYPTIALSASMMKWRALGVEIACSCCSRVHWETESR